MYSISEFLKSPAARKAAEFSGYSSIDDFSADSDYRIGLRFNGSYTIAEVRTLLADLERVQDAYELFRARRLRPRRILRGRT
jgi:hypothetical protein